MPRWERFETKNDRLMIVQKPASLRRCYPETSGTPSLATKIAPALRQIISTYRELKLVSSLKQATNLSPRAPQAADLDLYQSLLLVG